MTTALVATPRLRRAGLGLLSLVVVLLVLQVGRVHDATGEFRLTPSSAPPKLQEFGREYHRSDLRPATSPPVGAHEVGSTAGGGDVFGPRLTAFQISAHAVATVIWVRDGSGRVWTYALSGGP